MFEQVVLDLGSTAVSRTSIEGSRSSARGRILRMRGKHVENRWGPQEMPPRRILVWEILVLVVLELAAVAGKTIAIVFVVQDGRTETLARGDASPPHNNNDNDNDHDNNNNNTNNSSNHINK